MVLVLYNMALYMATIALPRFSVPIMPYVNILAAYALVNLFPNIIQSMQSFGLNAATDVRGQGI